MNNTNTTRKVRLNCNFNLLRTSLQGALDAMDTLLYAEQGNVETPAYIKKAVDMAEDKEQVILNAEQDLFDNIDAADSLAEKVLRLFINPEAAVLMNQPAISNPVANVPTVAEQLNLESVPESKTWEAFVYLFEYPAEVYHADSCFCKQAALKAAAFDLEFQEGEPICDFVCWSPEDDDKADGSWQNHQLPLDLQEALGLDMEVAHFAPSFLPLRLFQDLAHRDVVIEPKPGVRIKFKKASKQGAHLNGTYAETLANITEDWNQRQGQAEA